MTQASGSETAVTEEVDFDKAFGAAATEAEAKTQTPAVSEKATPQTTTEESKKDEEQTLVADENTKAAEDQAKADAAKAEEARRAALTEEQRTAEDTTKAKKDEEEKAATEAQIRLQAQAEAAAKAQEEEEKKAAATAKAAKEKAEQEALEKDLAPYEPNESEKAALATLEKEWPEQHAALLASLKSADQATKKKIHEAVAAATKDIAPLMESVQEIVTRNAMDAHLTKIRAAHQDFDDLVPKIPEWIKTQPALLQPTLQRAYDEGDTQSVIDLFTMYKAANKMPASTGESKEQIAAREAKEAAEKKSREEAAALVPTRSTRTVVGPKGTKDQNDFDGAFSEAAAELEK